MYNRIKEIRKVLKMSQKEFAEKLGFTQTSIGMIEVGKRSLSEKHIKLICMEFNINRDWFETGEGSMFNPNGAMDEFIEIFEELTPETQDFLIKTVKELLITQNKLLGK